MWSRACAGTCGLLRWTISDWGEVRVVVSEGDGGIAMIDGEYVIVGSRWRAG
jgi:hypothetical protein